MFRLCSLLLLLWGVASSAPAPVQADPLQSGRSRSKSCKKKVYGEVTNASATGPVSDGTTSIICTDITKIPYKTKTGHYLFLKVNGNYVKVLYTDVDSNWEGDYEVNFGELLTVSSPDTDGNVDIDLDPNTFPLFYPATGVIDGNKIDITYENLGTAKGTNDKGVVTIEP